MIEDIFDGGFRSDPLPPRRARGDHDLRRNHPHAMWSEEENRYVQPQEGEAYIDAIRQFYMRDPKRYKDYIEGGDLERQLQYERERLPETIERGWDWEEPGTEWLPGGSALRKYDDRYRGGTDAVYSAPPTEPGLYVIGDSGDYIGPVTEEEAAEITAGDPGKWVQTMSVPQLPPRRAAAPAEWGQHPWADRPLAPHPDLADFPPEELIPGEDMVLPETGEWATESDTNYLVPSGKDWAVWDDVNGVLSFMTDREVMENNRANVDQLGDALDSDEMPFRERLTPGTPEEAWDQTNEIWEGDPGGRGWQVRIPKGAQWVTIHHREHYTETFLPVPEWHMDAPPLTEGEWATPGYSSSFEQGLEDFFNGLD